MKPLLAPSLLSANFASLADELARVEDSGATWLHLDVMDGQFVPNITFGPALIGSLRANSSLFFDVHLMVEEPAPLIPAFVEAGADLVVIHLEAVTHPQRVLSLIRERGVKAGLALNPGTSELECRWLLPDIDLLLLMSVNPGFSGQRFIPVSTEKLRHARRFLDDLGFSGLPIEIDGGVGPLTAPQLTQAGASVLVSGSAFFAAPDLATARQSLCGTEVAPNAIRATETVREWRSRADGSL